MDPNQGQQSPPIPPAPVGMPGPVAPPAPSGQTFGTPAGPAGAPPSGPAQGFATPSPALVAPGPTNSSGTSPTATGCFRVDLRLNSIQFDYDSACPSQITQEQLELMGQIRKTEAALKAIFFPQGLPPDLHLRKPSGPRNGSHAHAGKVVHVASMAKMHAVAAQDHQDELDDDSDRAEAKTPKQKREQRTKAQFRAYFNALYILAQLGLDGPKAQPFLARSALANLKDQILTQEAGRIKNGYMVQLGEGGLYLGSIPFVLVLFYEILKWNVSITIIPWLEFPVTKTIIVFLFAWVGAMIGTFLSFALRNTTLTFDQLVSPEDDQMNPRMRLIYVGLLTFVFSNALVWKLITVTLGSVSTVDLVKGPSLGLLIGVLCGISERAIGEKLQKTADTLGK